MGDHRFELTTHQHLTVLDADEMNKGHLRVEDIIDTYLEVQKHAPGIVFEPMASTILHLSPAHANDWTVSVRLPESAIRTIQKSLGIDDLSVLANRQKVYREVQKLLLQGFGRELHEIELEVLHAEHPDSF